MYDHKIVRAKCIKLCIAAVMTLVIAAGVLLSAAEGQAVAAGLFSRETAVNRSVSVLPEQMMLTRSPVIGYGLFSYGLPEEPDLLDLPLNGEYTAVEEEKDLLQAFAFTVTKEYVFEEEIAFETEYIEEPMWTTAREEIVQEGSAGIREYTEKVIYKGYEEISRELIEDVVVQKPTARIVRRGVLEPADYIKPVEEAIFTSGFGPRWGGMHKGLDWACDIGTPVYAARDGVVEHAGERSTYGIAVFLRHEDGTATRYAHLSETDLEVGQTVKQGDPVALSGNTGWSTGPHLHFEILIDDVQVNPYNYLNSI